MDPPKNMANRAQQGKKVRLDYLAKKASAVCQALLASMDQLDSLGLKDTAGHRVGKFR